MWDWYEKETVSYELICLDKKILFYLEAIQCSKDSLKDWAAWKEEQS